MLFRLFALGILSLHMSSCGETSRVTATDNRTALFNGKDLTGWKQLNGKALYTVENNQIVGTTVSDEPNSFLVTEQEYGDFILELELKVEDGMNSGIQFRSSSRPDFEDGRVHGYQMEIDPSPRAWSGGIYEEGLRGWLYPLELNAEGKKAFRHNEWNKYRIECIGNIMRTWVNGIPTAHLVDSRSLKGFIALQVHSIPSTEKPGKQIRWRNINIQLVDLQPSPMDDIFVVNLVPNNLSSQEKEQGYKLLFDGNTAQHWRGAYKDSFPAKGWEIEEGELTVLASDGGESTNGGDIVSREEYDAFELKFDFRLSEGANSGVKYFVTEKEGNTGSAIGLEYQLLDDEKHPDAKMGRNGNRTLASLYDLIASAKTPAARRPIGTWNQGILRVYPDNRVEHWLNGYLVVQYVRGSDAFKNLVAESKYKDWENFGMAPKGRILLQDHGDRVAFRSIKIRALK